MSVKLKRVYEQPEKEDGVRILVDRIWPRGIAKKDAEVDYWLKNVGPSSDLRKWFGHDADKFEAFKERYKQELSDGEQHEELNRLKEIVKENNKNVTLVFAAKDEKNNQAQVLKEMVT